MIEETLNINSGSPLSTTAIYDGLGNLTNISYPGGRNLSYNYDALNRISDIVENSTNVVEYDYIGSRVEQKRFLNGTQIDYGYDGLGRIFDIIHTGSTSTLLAQAFNWDAMSNKTARSINGVTESYSYDDLYRLESFTYDDVGNRTDAGYSLGLPESSSLEMNEYISTPSGTFNYNANGNLSNIDSTAVVMAYDYRNQMVSYDDGTATTYKYDALGRRISKSNNTGETRYYSLGSRVIEETTTTNSTSATYVYGNYIDEVLSMNRSNNDYFYHADDIYNVMMLTNGTGGMAEDYDYDAFGAPDNISSMGNPYLFNGREYDTESGFYNYRTRYLDPSVGRFTTRDTIGIWGDPSNLGNGYTYVGNNPQSFLDPFELSLYSNVTGNYPVLDPRNSPIIPTHPDTAAWGESFIGPVTNFPYENIPGALEKEFDKFNESPELYLFESFIEGIVDFYKDFSRVPEDNRIMREGTPREAGEASFRTLSTGVKICLTLASLGILNKVLKKVDCDNCEDVVETINSPYQIRIEPSTRNGPMAIDTSKFSRGVPTQGGGLRNRDEFWEKWNETYGYTLSPENKSMIGNGSPVVDDEWIKHFPEHELFKGEILEHHHLNQGASAIPLPKSVHRIGESYKIWHTGNNGGN